VVVIVDVVVNVVVNVVARQQPRAIDPPPNLSACPRSRHRCKPTAADRPLLSRFTPSMLSTTPFERALAQPRRHDTMRAGNACPTTHSSKQSTSSCRTTPRRHGSAGSPVSTKSFRSTPTGQASSSESRPLGASERSIPTPERSRKRRAPNCDWRLSPSPDPSGVPWPIWFQPGLRRIQHVRLAMADALARSPAPTYLADDVSALAGLWSESSRTHRMTDRAAVRRSARFRQQPRDVHNVG